MTPSSMQSNPASSPKQRRDAHIMLAHGGGGQLTDELIGGLVMPRLGNAVLSELLDSLVAQERLDAAKRDDVAEFVRRARV